ncbi:signal peptide peptidase SppA [Antarcticirhabdus aurantiaca]|uniref:Signal peptide peptidase SppA n=1 Tax=Antarcticirhabdus aurantiaca TaxID=2606717 RepID=A0ACD4NQU2_9HYPH|nr:signal peptide peptidase SppA [Antarcticirhabdus aurantiaca]WAJ29030.1 signal peptide peptidase SppA [Jeongeuplla avenae]
MALSPDDMIDRRRLRRKLGFWRVAAILVAALAVLALPFAAGWTGKPATVGIDQIARVSVEGLITEDRDLLELLDRLAEDDYVKAVIVRVDSPGGTTVGGETIFNALRRIAETKPVVAEVGTLAASAGYLIAMASDHIVAHDTSIVGSIGVIFQYVDASKLLSTIGVDVLAVKSSPMKAEPSPFAPAPPESIEMIRRMILDSYAWFVGLVAERRGFTQAEAQVLADGSVWTGRQALERRLIDALGGEDAARAWLEKERGIPAGTAIVDREPDKDGYGIPLLGGAKALVLSTIGLDPTIAEPMTGLVSLWSPGTPGAP